MNPPFAYPHSPLARRHEPSGYKSAASYRPWLRDEFCFRCVFCLLRDRPLHLRFLMPQWFLGLPVTFGPNGRDEEQRMLTIRLTRADWAKAWRAMIEVAPVRLVADDPLYEVAPAHLELLSARGFKYEVVPVGSKRQEKRRHGTAD